MSLTQLLVHLLMFWKCSICSPTHHQRQHVQMHWNSSNGFFHSSGFLTVYLGDSIDFLCPSYERAKSPPIDDIEYNALYLVNEHDYHRCNTVNYHPLLRCTKPFDRQRLIYTLSISKYLPYPNLPEFTTVRWSVSHEEVEVDRQRGEVLFGRVGRASSVAALSQTVERVLHPIASTNALVFRVRLDDDDQSACFTGVLVLVFCLPPESRL
jgi:hypothetical protein